jgi:hypothetical protein
VSFAAQLTIIPMQAEFDVAHRRVINYHLYGVNLFVRNN